MCRPSGLSRKILGKTHLLAFRKLSDKKATWVSDVGSHCRPLVMISEETPEWDPCSFSHLVLPRITSFRPLRPRWDSLLKAFFNISGHFEINKTWSLTFQMTLKKQTARLNIEHQIKFRTWKKSQSCACWGVRYSFIETNRNKQTRIKKKPCDFSKTQF